ncbi:SDR family NAD(P)-dependent oxidoreductase [Kaistia nematophila]|uniref:SDR family oxidoreductase n=1 Tax=Kaistia nematophila TaxID=2994654 RepID=A0A9X3IK38_9HYPH|nr:SDR family oxidoreductase [Kaistia nematophila]MCX5568101.1 SDR family oxidoreductase [Kaistia nematophila]
MTRFVDKIVVVTGGAGAIGQAAVRCFLAEGAAGVAILDQDGGRAEALATELGERAFAVSADVTEPAAVDKALAAVVDRFGRIDVLFNNAGISGTPAPVYDLPLEEWDRVIRINLRGIFIVQQAVVRIMIAQKQGGAIVNMGSSMAGWDVLPGGSPYTASKHAVVGLTKVAALDCAAYGIRVNAICPGVIQTTLGVPAADQAAFEASTKRFSDRIPLRRIGQPEDVAAAVAFLASDDARHVTGVDWLIDGGQTLLSWANAPDADAFPRLI